MNFSFRIKQPLFSLSSPKVTQIKCKLCCLIDLWYSAFLYCTHISRTRKRNSKKKQEQTKREAGKNCVKLFSLVLISRQVSSNEKFAWMRPLYSRRANPQRIKIRSRIRIQTYDILHIWFHAPKFKMHTQIMRIVVGGDKKMLLHPHTHTLTHTQQWRQKKKNSS